MVFDEDAGFHATVFELAKSSRSPIVLTAERPLCFPKSIDPIVIRVRPPSQAALAEALRGTLSRVTEESSPCPAEELEVISRLGAGDHRKCLNILALAPPSPAVTLTGFESWVARFDSAYALEDGICSEMRRLSVGIKAFSSVAGARPVPESQLYSLHPAVHFADTPSLCALYGIGFRLKQLGKNYTPEVFVGSVSCAHTVLSDSTIVFRVPELECGTHQVRLMVASRLVDPDDWAPAIKVEPKIQDSDNSRPSSARVSKSKAEGGRRVRVVVDDDSGDEEDANAYAAAEGEETVADLIHRLLESTKLDCLPPEARQISPGESLSAYVARVRRSLEEALQEVASDIDVANTAFIAYERLRSLLKSKSLDDQEVFQLPDPFSLLASTQASLETTRDGIRVLGHTAESSVACGGLSDFDKVMELLSDADYLSRMESSGTDSCTSFLEESLENELLHNIYTSKLQNLAHEVRVFAHTSLGIGNSSSKDVQTCSTSSEAFDAEVSRTVDCGISAQSQKAAGNSSGTSCEFQSPYLRCLSRRSRFLRFYRHRFADRLGAYCTTRLRKLYLREFTLEAAPMVSKLLMTEADTSFVRHAAKATRRSTVSRAEFEYVRGIFDLPVSELTELMKMSKLDLPENIAQGK